MLSQSNVAPIICNYRVKPKIDLYNNIIILFDNTNTPIYYYSNTLYINYITTTNIIFQKKICLLFICHLCYNSC